MGSAVALIGLFAVLLTLALWQASQSSKPRQHNSSSTMLVKKCDKCKKEIKGRDEAVVVGLGFQSSHCAGAAERRSSHS
jgi:hypothetical protein